MKRSILDGFYTLMFISDPDRIKFSNQDPDPHPTSFQKLNPPSPMHNTFVIICHNIPNDLIKLNNRTMVITAENAI